MDATPLTTSFMSCVYEAFAAKYTIPEIVELTGATENAVVEVLDHREDYAPRIIASLEALVGFRVEAPYLPKLRGDARPK